MPGIQRHKFGERVRKKVVSRGRVAEPERERWFREVVSRERGRAEAEERTSVLCACDEKRESVNEVLLGSNQQYLR